MLQLTAAIPSLNLSFQNAHIKNGLEGRSPIFIYFILSNFKTLIKDFSSRAAALLLIIIGKFPHYNDFWFLNPQAPVAQKVADEVVFRRFRGEGVEFFKIGPH